MGDTIEGRGLLLGEGKGRSAKKEKKKKKSKETGLMNVTNRKIVGLFLRLALKVMINDSTRKR